MNIRHPGTMVAGVVFAIIGIAYLLEAFGVWQVEFRIWPVFLIAVGAVILLGGRHRSREDE
jgi:uncharacterized membrane protein YeaQ/YmgE (transglycosylase-associated protein family)